MKLGVKNYPDVSKELRECLLYIYIERESVCRNEKLQPPPIG